MTAPRRFEDVVVGEALPDFAITLTPAALVTYAAATWDFHRMHYDPAYAARAGLAAPVMDGQMAGGLIARQAMRFGGPDAFLRRLSYRLRAMVLMDERITVRGEVASCSAGDGVGLVQCRLDILKADGTAAVRDAIAVLDLPRRG
jgi:acyl dehydratase